MSQTVNDSIGTEPAAETVFVTSIDSIDLQELAKRVYQLLINELMIENERTGRRN